MYNSINEEYKNVLKSDEQQYDVYIILQDGTKIDEDISGFKPIYNLGEKIVGNFVTKRVEFTLFNTNKYNITNQEFEVFVGLKVNNEFNYISLGKFIANKPEIKDEAQDECSITAQNYSLKFKIPYEPILSFPCKVNEAIKTICNHLSIAYIENDFINGNYILEEFFIDEDATFFDVIKVLAEAGFANADITNTNSLIVKSPKKTIDYTFSINELFELKKEDNKFGPVNAVVASRIVADDGSTTEDVFARNETSITKNGLYEYKIKQNDAIDYDRQTAVNNILAGILDFGYVPATIQTVYNPASEVGDMYEVPDKKTDTSFLLFAKEITADLSTGLMTIESTEETKTETDYKSATNKDKRKKTEAKVNKLEGKITLLTQETNEHEEKIASIEMDLDNVTTRVSSTESGIKDIEQAIDTEDRFERKTEVQIDSVDNILDDVEMYGDLQQKTRSGKNIVQSFNDVTTYGITATNNEDGSISITGTSTASNTTNYLVAVKKILVGNVKDGDYTFSFNRSNTTTSIYARVRKYDGTNKTQIAYIHLANKITTYTLNLKELIDDNTVWLEVDIITFSSTAYNEKIYIQLEQGETATEYEQYGVSPSPDYPSEIEVVGDNINLFDKYNADVLSAYIYPNNAAIVSQEDSNKTTYIKCHPNTTYTITKKKSSAFRVGYCIQLPVVGRGGMRSVVQENDATRVTYTTGEDAQYLVFNYVALSIGEYTEEEIRNSIKIEKGTIATGYTSYGNGGVDYKVINKNFLDSKYFLAKTASGMTGSVNEDGSIRFNGTSTALINFWYSYMNITLKAGTYTFSSNVDITGKGRYTLIDGTSGTNVTIANQVKTNTFTLTKDVTLTNLLIQINSGVTFDNQDFYIQLEKNDTQTEYEEHQSQSTTIELPQGEFMAKIGDYEDYIDNKGVLHKYIKKSVGSELGWRLGGTQNFEDSLIFYSTTKDAKYRSNLNENIKSTHFENGNPYSYNVEALGIMSTGEIGIRVKTNIASTLTEFITWLDENNVEIYYELAEPYNVEITAENRKKYLNLPTLEGENNISISASTSGTYKRNTEMNKVYAKQNYVEEKFAEQVITNDSITSRVSATETTISNQSSDINSLNESIGSVNSDINNLQGNVETVKTQYTELKETVESFNFDVVAEIQQKLEDGTVTSNQVKTTSVTIDQDGIKVAKSGSEMQSLFDNEGLYVNKGAIDKTETKNNTLTVDKDGVVTENLYVRTYLTAGYHRTEGFIEDGKKRTGVFYQGGVDE